MVPVLTLCLRPQKRADIQKVTKISHQPTFRTNYLDPLLDAGLLARTIPDKPTSRLQKYTTTPAGKALLTRNQDKK
jgi:ATP-dependent DNA helicase RecG